MLYLEFWKSKQGIWFFDIHRLVFFDPLVCAVVKMQKYPTIATDYLGHIVGFIHKAILCQSEYLHIYLCHFLSVCEHISPGLNRLLWLYLDLKLSMSYFAVLFFSKEKKSPIYFKILLPLPYFAAYWEKSISKMFPPNFEKACSKCQVGCFRIKRQTASRVLLPLSWNLWQPDQKFHFQLKLFVLNLKFTLLLKQGG